MNVAWYSRNKSIPIKLENVMSILGIILILLGALLVGGLFYFAFKTTGPWGTFWSFLVVITLAGLAADAWITPVGPVAWGIAWIPTLFVMFLIALLLVAATPVIKKERESGNSPKVSDKLNAKAALGGFFWLLLLFLLGIIFWGVIGEHTI